MMITLRSLYACNPYRTAYSPSGLCRRILPVGPPIRCLRGCDQIGTWCQLRKHPRCSSISLRRPMTACGLRSPLPDSADQPPSVRPAPEGDGEPETEADRLSTQAPDGNALQRLVRWIRHHGIHSSPLAQPLRSVDRARSTPVEAVPFSP